MAYKTKAPAPVMEGGTGMTASTPYTLLCAGGTTTAAMQSVASLGTTGQVLTSNGAANWPTFQSISGFINSITGTSGGSQSGPSITLSGGTTGLSFVGSSNTITTSLSGITANNGTISLSTDAIVGIINIGTGGAVKTITIGSTTSTSTTTIQCAGALIVNSNGGSTSIGTVNGTFSLATGTGTISISADAANTSINVGTGAGVKIITIGSTTSTSTTTLQCSGALSINSNGGTTTLGTVNGALTVTTGTGTINISADTANTTINIGTGAGVKTVTLGCTNTTSTTVIKSGTGNITLNSGLTIDSTGRSYNPTNPSFCAYKSSPSTSVTGNGTVYTVICNTKFFDQGTCYDNTTGIFTAPISGRYQFNISVAWTGIGLGNVSHFLVTTGSTFSLFLASNSIALSGQLITTNSVLVNMTAGDTCKINVVGSGILLAMGINGGAGGNGTYFSGCLIN